MPTSTKTNSKPTLMITVGTRPEAIKMAPLVQALRADSRVETLLCSTGQHKEMLDQALAIFDLKPDFDLSVMRESQSLSGMTSAILSGLESLFADKKPDRLVVHGDTLTTFAASLSAFYHQIPVSHVEAGLRTGRMDAPWPEEGNRRLTSVMTDLHFAPTETSRQNLLREGVKESEILVTGNTVVDALLMTAAKLENRNLRAEFDAKYSFIKKKLILVTGHRRENFGEGILQLCEALAQLASTEEVDVLYPVHLNPKIKEPVHQKLRATPNIHLIEPVEYMDFVYLMSRASIILTDSGGIQEEAPSLGKPVLVMRDVTERPEAVEAGTVKLVGMNKARIVDEITTLLRDPSAYAKMSSAKNPYGDGRAAARIAERLIQSVL